MDLRRAGKALKLERGPLAPSYSEALEGSLDDGGDVDGPPDAPGSPAQRKGQGPSKWNAKQIDGG